MTMVMQRPMATSNRPAYLDGLFTPRDAPIQPRIHSAASSISTTSTASSSDLRLQYLKTRPLSPPPEEDNSDTLSTRSKKSFLSRRRFRLGTALHRRTYPSNNLELERPSTSKSSSAPSSPPPTLSPLPFSKTGPRQLTRQPSLTTLQTDFPPPQAISTYAKRPLPAVPSQKKPSRPTVTRLKSNSSAGELSCQRCYYFAARNCQGYVIGGEAGDPCESCLQSGFFGAK